MKETLHIRDPIHGTLAFGAVEKRVIDTAQMQKLRQVRQLAMAHLVYAGAHHTRFEHSLGTCYFAGRMAQALGLDEGHVARARLAGLLHDVGHIAFSHEAEEVTRPKLGSHEEMGGKIIRESEIADIISEHDDPKKVAAWACGEAYGAIIAGDIGADRLDYLLRDAHYTGVAYGVIDYERVISTIWWSGENGLVARAGGLSAVESVLLGRFEMFSTVYMHHAVRIASAMLQEAISAALLDERFDWRGAQKIGDAEMLSRLASVPGAKKWVKRLEGRMLLKRAATLPVRSLNGRQMQLVSSGKLLAMLRDKISPEALVSMPVDFGKKPKIKIATGEGEVDVGRLSPLVAALDKAMEARASVLVCVPGAKRNAAKNEAARFLGI